MRLRVVAFSILLVASGCTRVEVRPLTEAGSEVALSIVNRSGQPATIAHAFATEATSGEGEALIGACDAALIPIGHIAGLLRIRVDGTEVLASRVSEVPQEAGLVVRIVIGSGGEPHVVGPLPAVGEIEPSAPSGCT